MTLPNDLGPLVRARLHEPDGLPPPNIAEMGPLVRETAQERGFERQVAGRFLRRAGPVRPVNTAAIFTTTRSPKWRFQSMFSATKFLVAGAIVALFGGFVLSGFPNQQQSGVLTPAAATDPATEGTSAEPKPAEALDFSGTYPTNLASKRVGEMSLQPGGVVVMGELIEGVLTDLDDPRLNGRVRYVVNRIDHDSAGDVVSYVARIDNDGGSWMGSGYGYNDTADPDYVFDHGNLLVGGFDTTVFHGRGGYAGLSAIMVNERMGDTFRVEGVVFSGGIPELPELPVAPVE